MQIQDKPVKVGQVWQHFKGTDYQIVAISNPVSSPIFDLDNHLITDSFNAVVEATLEPITVYDVVVFQPKVQKIFDKIRAFFTQEQERSYKAELITIARKSDGTFVDVPMVFYSDAHPAKTRSDRIIWGRTLENFLEICGSAETCFYNRFEYKYSLNFHRN